MIADTPSGNAFPLYALRDYALLADGERGALIGPRGDIAWMCAPSWDSDAVFSNLVGGAGAYAVTPVGRFVWGGYYEDGTMIWRSRWTTEAGILECREALAFPGDEHRAVILRRITAVDGPARLHVVLELAPGFGKAPVGEPARDGKGVWTARSDGLHFRFSGASRASLTEADGYRSPRWAMDLLVDAGNHYDLVLEISDQPLGEPVDPDRAWRATQAAWADAVPVLENTLAPRDARQAYTVLRSLTASGGGMVAAATTSLPERAEEGRNYDYRYVWIRDQCYAGQAIAADGPHPLLDDAVRFVTARLHQDGPNLAPAYTTTGRPIPDQRKLDLPGYPGGYDIVGNHVNKQFQLDTFGEALLLLSSAARLDRLASDDRQAAEIAVEAIRRHWQRPDAGIWELDNRAWTHSRLICAAGLRAIAEAGAPARQATQWISLADTITADTAAHSLHPSGHWQRSPQDPELDAALLLPPIRGALAADDPRTVQTLRMYTAQLTQDHYAYRFRQDERPLEEAEGAFVLCGFVMALAELQQGCELEAVRWFERNRAACGPTGLYSEEYDIAQRQLRGNLPQAFVHALMLECAVRLASGGGSP
ncbi:glycoside hydrolase family 15 protein [Kitasatospora sp. NPDC056138]|uniref:glycoside hydrolase family 15 protein n=1 Tax=Kitasatospora sp. NPDC056138 TaxID=3345724 RepID=UPI0035D792A4